MIPPAIASPSFREITSPSSAPVPEHLRRRRRGVSTKQRRRLRSRRTQGGPRLARGAPRRPKGSSGRKSGEESPRLKAWVKSPASEKGRKRLPLKPARHLDDRKGPQAGRLATLAPRRTLRLQGWPLDAEGNQAPRPQYLEGKTWEAKEFQRTAPAFNSLEHIDLGLYAEPKAGAWSNKTTHLDDLRLPCVQRKPSDPRRAPTRPRGT